MLIGKHFKNKREEKGLSQEQVANLIRPGFEASLLWDFEWGDDTDIDGWLLADFKRYCEILEVKPTEYAEIAQTDLKDLDLPSLIKSRREEMGYSIADLSELIGFEEIVLTNIESGRASEVCLCVMRELSSELIIPLKLILSKI